MKYAKPQRSDLWLVIVFHSNIKINEIRKQTHRILGVEGILAVIEANVFIL